MKRISLLMETGDVVEWQCVSASYGPESRNVLMRNAKRADQTQQRAKEFILIPLQHVVSMTEDEW